MIIIIINNEICQIGTVHDDLKNEHDGDTHFVLTLDSPFAHLSKPINCQKTSTTCFEDVALGSAQQSSYNLIIVEIIWHNH